MSLSRDGIRCQATRLVAALVCVFLLFGPSITNLLEDNTRQVRLWRFHDSVVLGALIVSLAVCCVAARALCCRLGRPFVVRLFDHVFLLALGAGLLANLWFQTSRPVGYSIGQFGKEIRTLWIILGGLLGYSLGRPSLQLVLRGKQLCLILSPVMVLVGVQFFLAAEYPPVMDPLPPPSPVLSAAEHSPEATTHPVFLFICDEWSYERTYRDGAVRADMPHLASLSRQAVTFHNAQSCGDKTALSLPRLFFENDLPVVYGKGRVGFERDGQLVDSRELNSIFGQYSARGYRTFMIGFFLPLQQMLGDQVDVCRSYQLYLAPDGGLLNQVSFHALSAMNYWTDPWSNMVHARILSEKCHRQKIGLYQTVKRDMLEVITRQPANTFAMLHCPMPHFPYLFDDHGAFVGREEMASQVAEDVAGYERNLLGLDRLIGEVIAALTEAGRFDNALLIFTSDHSFRSDPERTSGKLMCSSAPGLCPVTHVPLVVKLPGQSKAFSVGQPYAMNHVSALVDCGLTSQGSVEGIARLVAPAPSLTAHAPAEQAPEAWATAVSVPSPPQPRPE